MEVILHENYSWFTYNTPRAVLLRLIHRKFGRYSSKVTVDSDLQMTYALATLYDTKCQNMLVCHFKQSHIEKKCRKFYYGLFSEPQEKMVLQNFCSGRHKFYLRLRKRNFLKASRLREANSNISQSFASQKLAKLLAAVASNFN